MSIKIDHNHSQYRPKIPKIDADDCPLISVMIPSYNCSEYLVESLKQVLDQDMGSDLMQIMVVDDHSDEDPKPLVEQIAGNRVEYFRQDSNRGHVRNFNTCIRKAKGKYIHILHADDIILDGFYKILINALESNPSIGMVFCNNYYLFENDNYLKDGKYFQKKAGIIDNFLIKYLDTAIQASSVIVPRKTYEDLGGFDLRISSLGEDKEMWSRIGNKFPVWYEPRMLLKYRVHNASLTARNRISGQIFKDSILVRESIIDLIRDNNVKELYQESRRSLAFWGLDFAEEYLNKRMLRSAINYYFLVAKYYIDWLVVKRMIGTMYRGMVKIDHT